MVITFQFFQTSKTTTMRLWNTYQETVKQLSRLLQDYCQETIGLLQHSCQETIAKIIEYFSLILQCTTTIILGATAYCIYSLLKMAEASINDLLPEVVGIQELIVLH